MWTCFRLRSLKTGLAVVLVLLVQIAAPVAQTVVAVPPPTGPFKVGTFSAKITDPNRYDPYIANGSKRELLIRLWYPASVVQGYELAEYASPKVWLYLSQITGVELPEIKTNSRRKAPVASGSHPLVLLTHGYTGTLTDYTFLAEDLASRGYVVGSVAHTYESTAVEFPDGRLVISVLGSHFRPDALRTDEQSLSFAEHVRLQDLSSVLDELQRLNDTHGDFMSGKLDLRRIAIMGHSLGGVAAITSVVREPRFAAAIVLDAPAMATPVIGTDKPVLILAAGRDQWGSRDCQLWRNLRGTRVLVHLRGAEHLAASDAIWLAEQFPELEAHTGVMGTEKTISAIRNYIAAFLDNVLVGKTMSPLLMRPSPDYPDIAFTSEKQALCGEVVKQELRSAK
jgi:dienelactone hydrolase